MSRQGLSITSEDRDLRALVGCVVIGGFGHEMPPGTRLNIRFDPNDVRIIVVGGDASVVPYSDIEALDIEGRGELRSGGKFFGGGFGVRGAVEGILVASVLNSLTAKSDIETIVGLRTRAWQLYVFWDGATPDALKRDLAPAYARLKAAHQAISGRNSAAPKRSVAEELAKINELYGTGALSADEFAEAKRKIFDQ